MLAAFFFILFLVSLSSSIPLNDLFPYGAEAGDSIMQSYNRSGSHFSLPHVFPYFDNIYRQIWIMNNGLFSFLQPQGDFSIPRSFPLSNDSSLVAGFWYRNIGSDFNDTGNKVFYQIHNDTSLSNSTMKVFNKASDYVRNFFPQQRPFKPKMVITGTWYYIGIGTNETSQLNNTFQIILCTDEDRSFVFFLYHELQWPAPYNYTYYNYNARAGFHSSDRNISETLPYSGTEDIVKLVNESNVNVPGLFAFRVDADQINAGGCNENVSMISFRPRIGSQLGSTALSIYGPCFTNQTILKCQFGSSSEIVNGIVIDQFRAVCLTPFSSVYGSILVNISIDNGQTFIPGGTFTYTPLQFGSDEVTIETEDGDSLLNVRQYVKLTWHFSEIIKNTFPNGTKIDIELWKLSLNQRSQLQKDDQVIILQQNLDLTDLVRVQLPASISNISTCFIRVIAKVNSKAYAALNTGLFIIRSQSSLANELCKNWAKQQPEPSTWNSDGLLMCPMTRQQAVAAARCCYKSDQQCYRSSSNPNNCWLHQARSGYDEPSAVECYVSITSNRHHAGAECCYDNDTMLITRGTGAGTDDRYGPSTSPVQHFFHDILPYLQCCMMSTNAEMCNKYMDYRPPRAGSNTMGENGRMWGDPHFGTLDGTSYTFNGYGEYTYLAISHNTSSPAAFDTINQSYTFMSQIRTIPLLSSNVTVTKGFAARSNNAEAESVSVTISRREHLILRRGNETLEFEDNINTFFFPELTITRLDGDNNSHFSFSWTIGVTIQINVIKMTSPSEQLVLNVAASVAGIFRGRTYGLLGTYDGTANNDLRSKNGSIISSNDSLERIHKDFGVTWAIDPTNSLFDYESNQSAEFFQEQNRAFIPSFIDPTTANNSTIHNICKINGTTSPLSWNIAQRTCYYDLSMTNDIIFAQASLIAGNELLSIRENQKNPPSFDSSLPLSMNLKHGDPVSLSISASSEYLSHIVELSELHRPENAIFERNTGIFNWTAIAGEHYLSIEARDTTYNLKSKHDIKFNVNGTGKPIISPGNGCNSQLNEATFIVLILAMIVRFCQ
jgi:hypothetical protein